MMKESIFHRIISILLIIVILTTGIPMSVNADVKKNRTNMQDMNKTEKVKPTNKEVKNKRTAKIPYGILKKEDILEKWSNKKELIEQRSENSKTYLNEDGSRTKLLFFEPIHIKETKNVSEKVKYGSNNLKKSPYLEVNNNLKKTKKNEKILYKNNYGFYNTTFSNNKNDGIEIEYDGTSLNLLPEELNFENIEVENNQAFIPSKTEGITYVYTVGNTSLKEDIVLDYLTNKRTYTYRLNISKEFHAFIKDEILYVERIKDKKVYYTLSVPYMMDREGKVSENISLSLKKENGQYLVTITPSWEWLNDDTRAYPVVIDPSINISQDSEFRDTYVESKYPDYKQYNNVRSYIGYDDGNVSGNAPYDKGHTKTYIKFKLPDDLTEESTIERAVLHMHAYTIWSEKERIIDLRNVTEKISIPSANASVGEDCVTWNTQPGLGSIISSDTITGSGDYAWNIKALVTSWIKGENNNGFALEMRSDTAQAEVFNSAQSDSDRPYIQIKYETKPLANPISDDMKLVLKRDNIYENGVAYAKSELVWDGEMNDESDTNRVTINYKLMPDGITGKIIKKNFTTFEWETKQFELKKNKAYWIEATVDVEKWVEADVGIDGETAEGYFEHAFTKNLSTKKFVVAESQPGDTLRRLAKYYLNNGTKDENIYKLNNLEDENLFVGQKLFVMADKEKPYNYDQPELITNTRMVQDEANGSTDNQTETVGQYINPVTGAFLYENTDFDYSVFSDSIDFTRSYVSTLENRKSPLGDGWDYNFNQYLMFYKDGTIGYNRGDGSRIYFTKSDSKYTTTAQSYDSLKKEGAEYSITTDEKTVYTFSKTGLLTKIANGNGNCTTITYDENDWQNEITDAQKRTIRIEYYDSDSEWMGNIKQVKLPDTSTLTFDYEEDSNHLITYSDREGNDTNYKYNTDGQLIKVMQAEDNSLVTNQYQSSGKVSKQTDGENNNVSLTYNDITTTVLDGRSLSYQYQADDRLRVIRKIYPDKKFEVYEYNNKGDILTFTDKMGRVHEYTYNTLGYLTSYIRPEDKKSYTYEYKNDYLLTKEIDFDGHITTMSYDSNGYLDKESEEDEGKWITNDYDYTENGLLEKITDPDGIQTKIDNTNYPDSVLIQMGGVTYTESYDVLGRTLTYTDGNNNSTKTSYDKNGNVLAVIYPFDGDKNRIQQYKYDKNNNLISLTGSRLISGSNGYATTSYTYDGNNQLIKETDPYNEVNTYTYDGNGNVLTETDEAQYTSSYEYDSNNQLIKIFDNEQSCPSFIYEYDPLGNVVKETEADGDYTEYEYDYKVGQVSKEKKPENETISYTYDNMGNMLTESNPESRTTYVYDSLYQPIKIEQTGEATTYISYTAGGNIKEKKDEKGITYTYHYDPYTDQLAEIVQVVADNNESKTMNTKYTYDSNGNVKTETDQEGNVTSYQYNEINEVSQITDPMNKVTSYSYDEDGNVSKMIDGEGNITEFQYDAFNQLNQEIIPEENTTNTYLYDSRGNLKSYIDPMGNLTSYAYDAKNRMTKIIDAKNQSTEYHYNNDDTLSKIIYPNGQSEEYAYDHQNRVNWYKDRAAVTYNIKYTVSGNTDSITDSVGNDVSYRYDSMGRLTEVEDTIGRITSYSYDKFGRQISETGDDGNVTTYEYDPLDRIRNIIDPEQKVTSINYDSLDNIRKIIKPGQRNYTYDYDKSGNLIKATDPLGNATAYNYNKNNEVSEIINAKGFVKKYKYNALNLVEQVTDERGYTTTYDYYPGGMLKSKTDPLDSKTSYTYDEDNQLSSITNALNETTTYTYDYFGNMTSEKDSRGVTTIYNYDARDQVTLTYDTQNNCTKNEYYENGDLKKETDAEGNTTEYIYDAVHRVIKEVEPNGLETNYLYNVTTGDLAKKYDNAGQSTTYTYDKMHRLLTETDIQGLITSYTYDEFGNQSSKTTSDGNTTTYRYDELDRMTSIIDPENNLTQYAYDSLGNVDYVIKPTNQRYNYTYDAANNIASILDPLGEKTEYTYDGNNNIATMVDQAGNQYSYKYDALNRLQSVTDLTGSGSRYQYDASGNISSYMDGNGNETKYQYNNLNLLNSVEDAEGNITHYTYDKNGDLKTMTDANGNTSKYSYDEVGNLTSYTNPLGEVIQYHYNLIGKIDKEIKADGRSIHYVYDKYNRLDHISYPDNTSVNYTYDKNNRKVAMEDANGITEYSYDDMSRLTSVSDLNSEEIRYEYDDKGRKTAVIYPDEKRVEYRYDEFNRIIEVKDREGRITKYTYDKAGRKKTTTLPNGITTTYEYDKANRILSIISLEKDGTTVLKLVYEYDGAGNRTLEEIWQEDEHYKREYTYYKNNTVKSMKETGDNEVTYSYVYDSAGNITEKRVTETKADQTITKIYDYSYNSANRMLKQVTKEDAENESRTYRYDANGNRIARVYGDDETDKTTDYYYYDSEDRLVEIVLHNGKVFTYGYDGEGNRLWRTYSQYPLVKPPVEDGERLDDPATFPGYNKDNNKSESENVTNSVLSNADDEIDSSNVESTKNEADTLHSLLSIKDQDELMSTTDSYLYTVDSKNDVKISSNDSKKGNSESNGDNSKNSDKENSGNSGNNSNNTNVGNSDKENKEENSNNSSSGNNSNKGNNGKNENGNTGDKSNNGYDKNLDENGNGNAYGKNKNKNKTNNGKSNNSNGSKNEEDSDNSKLTNPEVFEVTNYINDINQEYTQVLMTTDVDGNYRGVYTYGNGERISEEDLGKVEGVPNNPLYYLSDALGSTIAITNRNAEIIDQNRFAPYGEAISPVAKNARLTNSPWGYTGESHDIEGGLLYLRNRYYEPETARFIQQDSYPYFGEVKNPIARNLYAYGNDNPLLYTDPSGHMNYIKQSDDLLRGVAKGAGSWVKDIITTPRAIYDLAKLIISGKISIKKLAKSVGNGLFEDYRYVIKHKSVLNPTKKASNKSVKKFGYHMGKITLDIVSAIVGGKLVSSFSKTKTGQKLIRKFKKIKNVKKEKTEIEVTTKGAGKSISYSEYEKIYQSSIHNAGKDKIMLGKYDGGGTTSYISKAGKDYTYFSLGDDWNVIKKQYGFTDDDMFKLFNESFLDDGINAGKSFTFSHNPIGDTGALGMEYKYLKQNGYVYNSSTMTMTPKNK